MVFINESTFKFGNRINLKPYEDFNLLKLSLEISLLFKLASMAANLSSNGGCEKWNEEYKWSVTGNPKLSLFSFINEFFSISPFFKVTAK